MLKFSARAARCAGVVLALLAACRSVANIDGGHRTRREERRMERDVDGQQLAYRLDVPTASDAPSEGWPLLLFLHGAGERGDDLELVGVHGPPKWIGRIPELQRCILVTPQCPSGAWWQTATLKVLVDEVRAALPVDADRIYVSGLSMGGYGTWALVARHPEFFAAAVPICGGGDPSRLWSDVACDFQLTALSKARDVPIWAFHGADDAVVPVEESRRLVRVLQEVGGDVQLTVYRGVGHDSWTRTYSEHSLYQWLFEQRRSP